MKKDNKRKRLCPFAAWNREQESDCLIFGGEVVPLMAESPEDAAQKYAISLFKLEPAIEYHVSIVDGVKNLYQFTLGLEPDTIKTLKFKVHS